MQIKQMPITRGPDKWKLAESLFHDDEMPEEPITLSFTVHIDGKEASMLLSVDTIGRLRNECDLYRIEGIGRIIVPRSREELARNAPILITFSTRDRKGIAQIEF